ncbi:MAG TPA: AcrB/AcrD/AcrF family protein [Alphaproteobacteria bacterium]|nr:AcrB/AcrD/AcrF family protein [Alphaproteobacteria bacterium]HAJ47118.1 AcrB/AcrD/AcrF family protein [Alphaproteobacteria bacterium]
MWISDLSIRRPVLAVMVIGALVALGWISYQRIGVDLFPRVEFPFVVITTVLDGASPETVETEVTDTLESQVNTIAGIKSLNSQSTEGISQVIVEFGLSENPDTKAQDVRDKVNLALRDLPQDAEQPIIQKLDPDAEPILSVMLSGDMPVKELTRIAEKTVKEQLQRVPGVGDVALLGGRKRQIRIWLDADRLRAYNLTADDVVNALRRENANVPAGRVETGGGQEELGVKTNAQSRTVAGFGEIVVAFRGNALPTRIRDIARVEDGVEDERSAAALNMKPGISLEVRRQSGQNTLAVAKAVKAEVERLRSQLPPTIKMTVARDISVFIEDSIHDVTIDIIIGIFLVVVITWAFLLDFRATVIVAVAMPTSLIATFFAFYWAGFTLNMMTLMAFSVAIGLLVDDAIVVLESVHHKLEQGLAPNDAASTGSREVAVAVMAGTWAVVAVFVPIAFMEGIVGRFFFQYGLAIVFSVLVSLLVSLTLTPMLCARFLTKLKLGPISSRVDAFHHGMEAFYRRILHWVLDHRWLTMAAGLATVVAGVTLARGIPFAFQAKTDRAEFLAKVDLPFGMGIAQSKVIGARVADALLKTEHIETVFMTIGSGAQARVNRVNFYVGLTPKKGRTDSQFVVMQAARKAMAAAAPEATHIEATEVPWVSGNSDFNADVTFSLVGPSLDVLRQKADAIVTQMKARPAFFTDARSSYEPGKPEVQISVDRARAADQGVAARSLATTVRALVGGVDAGTYEELGDRYDVRVRLQEDQRNDPAKLAQLQVRNQTGGLTELSSIADFTVAEGPAQINRRDRARTITIIANLPPGVALGTATNELQSIVREVNLGPGYAGIFTGQAERMKESAAAIGFAFVLAMVALYMILASQFDRFFQPLIVMLTAPLSFVGAFAALAFSGFELTLFAQIGMIALMGLVMKNGILLVDYANTARQERGLDAKAAIAEAGPRRMRPVLMTQLATVFGMIPVAISVSQGAEFRNGMGVLIIGGILSSTFLTLLIVPVAYSLMDDGARLVSRLLGSKRQSSPEPAE